MTKPGSNPYTRKLKPVMTKYLTGRFGAAEGASRWQRTLQIAQQYWDETAYIGGRENILADNLYMSEVLFAAVEACDRDFPGEDILRLGDELMVDKIRRLSRFVNAPRLVNRRWVQRLVGRMYGSYIMETAATNDLFYETAHPYTKGLMRCLPESTRESVRLALLQMKSAASGGAWAKA